MVGMYMVKKISNLIHNIVYMYVNFQYNYQWMTFKMKYVHMSTFKYILSNLENISWSRYIE